MPVFGFGSGDLLPAEPNLFTVDAFAETNPDAMGRTYSKAYIPGPGPGEPGWTGFGPGDYSGGYTGEGDSIYWGAFGDQGSPSPAAAAGSPGILS